jgi:hypothetical protein
MDAGRRMAGSNAGVAVVAGSLTSVAVGTRGDATFVCDVSIATIADGSAPQHQRRQSARRSPQALDDRTWLKVTADPSATAFRNAFPGFALDPAALVELDRRLEKSHPDFAPHPLWLAWIQTGRRPGLEAIKAEIRLRLSESDAATPTQEPSNAEVALTARPARKMAAKPASKAVRKAK